MGHDLQLRMRTHVVPRFMHLYMHAACRLDVHLTLTACDNPDSHTLLGTGAQAPGARLPVIQGQIVITEHRCCSSCEDAVYTVHMQLRSYQPWLCGRLVSSAHC